MVYSEKIHPEIKINLLQQRLGNPYWANKRGTVFQTIERVFKHLGITAAYKRKQAPKRLTGEFPKIRNSYN